MERVISDSKKNEQFLGKRLDASDPRRILARGYAFLADEAGQPVRSVAALKKGDALRARLADGMVEGVIEKT
jgi:exodeoxyribonuclease VII large subunit